MATIASGSKVETYLGAKAESLLGFKSPKIAKERLHLPGPKFIDEVYAVSDRNIRVLTNLQRMFGHGRPFEGPSASRRPIYNPTAERSIPVRRLSDALADGL